MSLGESILDHYELFLGKYIGVDKYTSGEYVIQLLGFDRTFKDCLTFASLGLSNYSNLINNSCEVIMPVDDDYDNCAVVFANALFYVLQQQMDFGRGTIIEGLDNIIEDHLKMYIAFFISEKELEFIHNYGCEEFENLLESSKADIINLNRESIV